MCGIAGFSLRPGHEPDPAMLTKFAVALAHRGPDGTGSFIARNAALVHTRLSIIDLQTGGQPLFSGPLTLVANGEIYNFMELREALPADYKTGSDCEPPLAYFSRFSDGYPKYLRGMYAIAIHDRAFHTVTLSRDPFGIKPLYTAAMADGIAFASQPSALLAAGLCPRALDAEKLNELLNLQYTTGTKTIFSGINRVALGETITTRDGAVSATKNMPAWETPLAAPVNEADALTMLDSVLENSVDLHQRSDVPYGMFLSGGVDSAVVLAMMARLNSSPVLAYTAGFDVAGVADERDDAAVTARAAGARHERVEITEAMVWEYLPEIVAAMDDPAADYAIIPSWFLARRARADVKVILSGEGGDEMFAGYGRYRATSRVLFPKQMRARGIFDGLDVLRPVNTHWRDGIADVEAGIKSVSRLRAAQRADIADWLPNDLLLKLDRCLMAHGVEGRTPFVDAKIAQFAFSLPEKMLIRDGRGKYLLRLWLEKHLPAARPFAKKQGFDVPVAAWIAGRGKDLGELVSRSPLIAELAPPERVKKLFAHAGQKREGFAAWVLLFTALWHRRHVLDLPPGGNLFDTLREI
jgi:asparagine synthase (glutamine-hydrolysing)